MSQRQARRGAAYVQYLIVAAAIFMVVVVGFSLMTTNTNTKLNQTASDVSNPSALTQRFGSQQQGISQGQGDNRGQN